MPDGRRLRRNYKTKAEALVELADLEDKLAGMPQQRRSQRTVLNPAQISDAEAAFQVIGTRQLSRIVSHYLDLEARAKSKGEDLEKALAFFEGRYRPEIVEKAVLNARDEFTATRVGLADKTKEFYTSSTKHLLRPWRVAGECFFRPGTAGRHFVRRSALSRRRSHPCFSQPAWLRISPAVRYTRNLWAFLTEHRADAIGGMIDALGEGHHLPEGPEPETHTVAGDVAAVRETVQEIIARWKREGLCQPAEVLILHHRSSIELSPLGDLRVLGVWNVRDCQDGEIPADAIRHGSINKAKGLDAKAVIVVGLPPFEELKDDFGHHMWFMATSRARQLLAMVHCL